MPVKPDSDNYDNLEEESIKRLASDINEESTRLLITSVQNILDMTRISEGHLTVKKEFESVDDLINQGDFDIHSLVHSKGTS